jgi:hypothetical protein
MLELTSLERADETEPRRLGRVPPLPPASITSGQPALTSRSTTSCKPNQSCYRSITLLHENLDKNIRPKIFRFNAAASFRFSQCCGPGMFILDPDFSYPGSRIRIKEFNYFRQKNGL